jgi:malonyl CoA-acyl carrier protein transacylase/acyl carrier protein
MRPAANELALELENIEFNPPRIPVYSNTTGMPYPNAPEAVRGLLSRHIEEPLDFVAEIKRLYKDGAFVFIEVGPGKVLSGLIETILDDRPHIVLSFDSPGRSGTYQLAHLLAQAGALGLPVNLSFWFRASGHEMPDIETIFKNAEKSADPSPMTWRISNGSIAPWHLKSNDFLMKNPRNNLLKEDNRTMNEKRNNSYIDPVLKDSESLILRIQANLDQFIELQQNQQRLMDRFLDLQQQLMTAALNGNGSAGKDSGVLPAEKTDHKAVNKGIHLASPPAPSLPKLMPINPSQVKPHTGFRPVLSEPGKKVLQYNHEQIYSTPRFQADLLRIVSEQTGYPENMLDLDANLEADLGIDSIKRVEIFSLLGDHHQLLESQREEMVLEELANLKSLRKIIEWYDKNRMLLEEQTSKKS